MPAGLILLFLVVCLNEFSSVQPNPRSGLSQKDRDFAATTVQEINQKEFKLAAKIVVEAYRNYPQPPPQVNAGQAARPFAPPTQNRLLKELDAVHFIE